MNYVFSRKKKYMKHAAQLKTKAEKRVDELPQIISSKNVLLAFDNKTWRNYVLFSLHASDQRDIWAVTWDFQQCGMYDQQSLRSACAYAQPDQSLCYSFEYSMTVKLLTEHHLEFLSIKGSCTGSSESTLVKMPLYLKSHVAAHMWIC